MDMLALLWAEANAFNPSAIWPMPTPTRRRLFARDINPTAMIIAGRFFSQNGNARSMFPLSLKYVTLAMNLAADFDSVCFSEVNFRCSFTTGTTCTLVWCALFFCNIPRHPKSLNVRNDRTRGGGRDDAKFMNCSNRTRNKSRTYSKFTTRIPDIQIWTMNNSQQLSSDTMYHFGTKWWCWCFWWMRWGLGASKNSWGVISQLEYCVSCMFLFSHFQVQYVNMSHSIICLRFYSLYMVLSGRLENKFMKSFKTGR